MRLEHVHRPVLFMLMRNTDSLGGDFMYASFLLSVLLVYLKREAFYKHTRKDQKHFCLWLGLVFEMAQLWRLEKARIHSLFLLIAVSLFVF